VTEIRAMSHSIITGLVLSNVDVFSVMTKVQIQQLLRAYNIKFKSSSNKSILVKDLENAILNCASMPNPIVLDKHEHSQSSNEENVVHDFQESE
jgi:predicted RNase H-like nuclease